MNEHFTGVGRVIGADEDLVGVDLDDCLDPETGELTEHAARIAKRLATYTEISPSRRGFKLWLRAPDVVRSYKKPGLEIYSSRRYFTITGLLLPGAPWTVEERQEALQDIIAEEFPRVDRVRTGYYDGPARRIDLLGLLERASIEIFQEAYDETAEVKFDVLCPWYEEHTTGTSGTACGQYENGALFFRCYHSHCEHRTWHDFRRYAEALAYLGRPPRRERGRVR
jgi:hypothetical protein